MPLKPTSKEEEYFAREEAIKLRKLAIKNKQETAEEEKRKLRELHHMHCPKCGMNLHPITVNRVEVDKCFSCGGLYLDDGELEKISGREQSFFRTIRAVLEEQG